MDSGCRFVLVPEGVQEGTESEIREPHCMMGLILGGSECKSAKTGQVGKARYVERTAIETENQIDQ
jgi:hypothetical protein